MSACLHGSFFRHRPPLSRRQRGCRRGFPVASLTRQGSTLPSVAGRPTVRFAPAWSPAAYSVKWKTVTDSSRIRTYATLLIAGGLYYVIVGIFSIDDVYQVWFHWTHPNYGVSAYGFLILFYFPLVATQTAMLLSASNLLRLERKYI